MARIIFLVMIQTCVGLVYSMDTYYMTTYCGATIDMVSEGINTGRLELDTSFTGECNVTIAAWIASTNRLMFYFDDVAIPETSVYCQDTFFEVYYGQPPDVEPFYDDLNNPSNFDKTIGCLSNSLDPNETPGSSIGFIFRFKLFTIGVGQLMGIPRLCGSSVPSGDFVSKSRYMTFRFVNKQPTSYARLKLIFTAFHRGHCYSYEYRCDNGRCIDDSVNCNGYNPCGDSSDCHLSEAAIVGIVVGALFAFTVILSIACVIHKQRRARKDIAVIASETTSPFNVTPAALLHSVPPPSYGTATQYVPTQQVYGVSGTIQGDDRTH